MSKQIKALEAPDLNEPMTAQLLGKAVRARRTQSQLRIEDASALCGVAKQTLMNVEHGTGTTQLNTILQICAGLGITLQIKPWLRKGEGTDEWQ